MNIIRQFINWIKQLFTKKEDVVENIVTPATISNHVPKANPAKKSRTDKGDVSRIGRRHGAKRKGYR